MIWLVANWVQVALQLVVIYFDYNSTQDFLKNPNAHEAVPFTAWFQKVLGRWWWTGTVALQSCFILPFAIWWPAQRWGFDVVMTALQAWYVYSVILPNYRLARAP